MSTIFGVLIGVGIFFLWSASRKFNLLQENVILPVLFALLASALFAVAASLIFSEVSA